MLPVSQLFFDRVQDQHCFCRTSLVVGFLYLRRILRYTHFSVITMSVKVYFDLMSQPSRAVLIFLRAAQIAHAEHPVALRRAEHQEEAFSKVNSLKRVPAIIDEANGLKLTESGAIMRYLASEYLSTDRQFWYPKENKLRAKVDEYLDWHHLNTRLNCVQYFRNRTHMDALRRGRMSLQLCILQYMFPATRGTPVDVKKVQQFRKGVDTSLGELNSYFLQDKKFFLGNNISIADLQAVCEIEQLVAAGVKLNAQHPEVMEWVQRVRDAADPYYTESSKIILELAPKLKALVKSKGLENGVVDE